jgi:hypothetical protein
MKCIRASASYILRRSLSGAAPAASDPVGYFTAFDSTARVIYRGHDNHIHELYYTVGGGWGSADLTP